MARSPRTAQGEPVSALGSRDAGRRPTVDVSVVVPFANAAPYIERAIAALLAQRFPRERSELILVDNVSADGSAEIARRHPEVTVLCEPRRGAYRARNLGVAAAGGSVIAFTDADCAPAPDWLETMVGALEAPGAGVALGRVVSPPPSRSLALVSAYEHERARFIFGGAVADLYFGYTNNMAARRAVVEAVGPFEEVDRGADVVFVRRAAEALGPGAVRYAADAVVEHLEMTGARAWLRKMFIYGKSSRYYRVAAARTLTGAERLDLYRRTVRGLRCPPADRARLLALLAAGVAVHVLGRWSAAGSRRP